MKKEKQKQEKILWQGISDPYQVIAEFFFADDVANSRKYIKRMLTAACSNTIFSKSSPGDLLHFSERLTGLMEAANVIKKKDKKSPFLIEEHEMFNPNLYCGWHSYCTKWDFFPRSLSRKEYINPYCVFPRFFGYHEMSEWKEELHHLVEYALLKDSVYDVSLAIDSLSTYAHLTKLIEAAHLIDVREINHIEGKIKSRAKANW